MKKMLLLLRWPAYYRMCSTDVYWAKQTGSSSTKAITVFLGALLELGELSMQPKFVAAQKMLV